MKGYSMEVLAGENNVAAGAKQREAVTLRFHA